MKNLTNPFKSWLSHFFFNRDPLNPIPNGGPLYTYAVNENEYRELCALFYRKPFLISGSVCQEEWCACYCLAVSETYRREYSGGEWSWAFFDNVIGTQFDNEQQRYKYLKKGLAYWRREWKYDAAKNTRYLGTLVAEGGLPLKMLAADDNAIRNIIDYGLKKYQESMETFRPLEEYIAERVYRLAQVFRDTAAVILFADTVRALVKLAERFDLKNKRNLVEYLDQADSGWRSEFPFALDGKQVDAVINRWLGNAADERQKLEKQEFSCRHYVKEGGWCLHAKIGLPEKFSFPIQNYQGKTVLQWQIFEGEEPVAQMGATVFASLSDTGGELTFKLPFGKQLDFVREKPSLPLSVRVFAGGRLLYTKLFGDTGLDEDAPLVFHSAQDQRWQLFSTNEYTRSKDRDILIHLPDGFRLSENENVSYLGGQWFKCSDGLTARHADGREIVVVQANQTEQSILHGRLFYHCQNTDGLPVYRGFPTLLTPPDLSPTHIKINGEVQSNICPSYYGTFQVAFYKGAICLLRRKITVLPEDFSYTWQAASNKDPAILNVNTSEKVFIDVFAKHLDITQIHSRFRFICQTEDSNYPSHIILAVGSNPVQAARLRLPLPFNGAYLYDEKGRIDDCRLNINQLLGKWIMVYSSASTDMRLVFKLSDNVHGRPISISERLSADGSVQQFFLDQWKPQLLQLLSCSSSQDAQVEITVCHMGSENPLIRLILSRYNGLVMWNNQFYRFGILAVTDALRKSFVIKRQAEDELTCREAVVNIMRLDAPEKGAQRLPESAMRINGHYQLSSEQYDEGLWLIYPAPESPVQFRPAIFDNSSEKFIEPFQHHSLHIAARAFHPNHNPEAISRIITEMVGNPEHSGWLYFESLKQHFSHLPLSVFETWKALVQQPKALALAVLRLRLDGVFCERMRNELAVVWEWLALQDWFAAISAYKPYIRTKIVAQGLNPDDFPLPENCIPTSVLCHDEILRNHVFKGFLSEIEMIVVEKTLGEIFDKKHDSRYNRHYNALRQNNNQRIPETLSDGLQKWLEKQQDVFFNKVRCLSKVPFDRAVVWLPVFTACVKAGNAQPSDIMPLEMTAAQFADAFYRIYALDAEWFDYVCASLSCYLVSEP